jgi:hypothetical protein
VAHQLEGEQNNDPEIITPGSNVSQLQSGGEGSVEQGRNHSTAARSDNALSDYASQPDSLHLA